MKQIEADIAIIGGGTAGLASAVASAERGTRVVIFEKASTTGGTGNRAVGLLAVESRLQRAKKILFTREQAFNTFMEHTHWRVDARLVKAYIDKSASTIEWLEGMGVEFYEPAAYFPGSNFTWHTVKLTPTGTGAGAAALMMKAMTAKARELGVEIYLQTPAREILKEGGRITGVTAEDKSGEIIQVKAKAVIVASGGFGDNPDMIKEYTGYDYGKNLFSIRVPGMMGEGIRMAWEAGAAPSEMSMEMIFSFPPPFEGLGGTLPELAAFRQPNLMVNLDGDRIVNEEVIKNTTYMGNAIVRQKGSCGFMIFDEATKKDYEENGMYFTDFLRVESIDANIQQAIERGCEYIFVVDSLEELADKTGIDLPNLRKTIDEYNRYCDSGRDELFHKNAKYLKSVKQPRFYAGKFYPSAYGSLGGIKINYKTEVVDKNQEVIPGLYAAGVDANTIYGDSYIFTLPGNSMGFAVNSGRVAGENAAEYVKPR